LLSFLWTLTNVYFGLILITAIFIETYPLPRGKNRLAAHFAISNDCIIVVSHDSLHFSQPIKPEANSLSISFHIRSEWNVAVKKNRR